MTMRKGMTKFSLTNRKNSKKKEFKRKKVSLFFVINNTVHIVPHI